MSILALDLGVKCGWATSTHESGVCNLKPSSFDSIGERYRKFKLFLDRFYIGTDIIVYEEVRMHVAVDAAHVYGALMGILQLWCLENNIEYRGVPVGTIKKYATGRGNAKKSDMIAAAVKLFPSVNVIDDNHADALCLLHYAQFNLARVIVKR